MSYNYYNEKTKRNKMKKINNMKAEALIKLEKSMRVNNETASKRYKNVIDHMNVRGLKTVR